MMARRKAVPVPTPEQRIAQLRAEMRAEKAKPVTDFARYAELHDVCTDLVRALRPGVAPTA